MLTKLGGGFRTASVALIAFSLLALVFLVAQQPAAPPRLLIVYHSESGHTQAMAEAVARGARSIETIDVVLTSVERATNEQVLAADAIILGSPVYNANVAPQVQTFINGWPFRGSQLKDKIGAAFVSAGGISAGEEATQLSLLRSMLMFGMIVVGEPDWRQAFGASAIVDEAPHRSLPEGEGKVEAQFLAKAEGLGKRVADLTRRWHGCR